MRTYITGGFRLETVDPLKQSVELSFKLLIFVSLVELADEMAVVF